jgi:hypothetical protein
MTKPIQSGIRDYLEEAVRLLFGPDRAGSVPAILSREERIALLDAAAATRTASMLLLLNSRMDDSAGLMTALIGEIHDLGVRMDALNGCLMDIAGTIRETRP